METTKLKVLNPGLISPYQNFQYEIGKRYICKDFNDDPSVDCSRGFYATDIEGLPYSWNINRECYEVQVTGKSVYINIYKQRFEKQKILRKVEKDELISLAKEKDKELGYKLSKILFPVNPLLIKAKRVTGKEIRLLNKWTSVGDSVWTSVWASVRASVGDSVGASVWTSVWASVGDSVVDSVVDSVGASVRDSVRDSVEDSVVAYISSLFPNIKEWKYIKHKKGISPFQPCIDLWKSGFVPSFDGKTWRLHVGEAAKIVYELTTEL